MTLQSASDTRQDPDVLRDAARRILGALLKQPDLRPSSEDETLCLEIDPACFSDAALRRIFEVCRRLATRAVAIDEITVAAELGDGLRRVGGMAGLCELEQACPTVANVRHYAALLKRSRPAATEDTGPPLAHKRIRDYAKRITSRSAEDDQPIPMPSNWGPLAEATRGGWRPGVHIAVGSTGAGKTALALEAAYHASPNNPALYVALETPDDQLDARVLSLASGVPWSAIYAPTDGGTERAKALGSDGELDGRMLHLVSRPAYGWSAAELAGEVQALRARYGAPDIARRPMFVVVDYLQIIGSPTGAREDTRTRIQQTVYAARNVATEFNAAVLLLSSTSREGYHLLDARQRHTKAGMPEIGKDEPSAFLGTGKECGEIEYSADTVLVMCADANRRWVALAKCRTGPTCWLETNFDGKLGTFFFPGDGHG